MANVDPDPNLLQPAPPPTAPAAASAASYEPSPVGDAVGPSSGDGSNLSDSPKGSPREQQARQNATNIGVAARPRFPAGAALLAAGLVVGAALTFAGLRLLPIERRESPAVLLPPPLAGAGAEPARAARTMVAMRGLACRGPHSRRRRRGNKNSAPSEVRIEDEGHWLTITDVGTPCWVLISGHRR